MFIHELTHAWQIANHTFTPGLHCRAAWTQVAEDNAYAFPMYDGRAWASTAPSNKRVLVMHDVIAI